MIREKDIEVEGKNPFDEELKLKINLLEAFQTERTAKEFYEIVQKIFLYYNASPKRPWFGERRNIMAFSENQTEAISLTIDRGGEIIAHYGKYLEENIEKEVLVEVVPTYRIIALDKRRREGEISPLEKMPTAIGINGKYKNIDYS
jgi:hypothetical protein